MSYRVELVKQAQKDLRGLSGGNLERVASALEDMKENPCGGDHKKLKGSEIHRTRVGNYRILFSLDSSARQVLVRRIVDRKDAY